MLVSVRPAVRTLLLAASTLAALSAVPAQAQPAVTVRIDTPEFGVRIGQPLPRYGAPGVIVAPVPVYGPPVVHVPYPAVVVAPPPVIYAPPPRVIYAPPPRVIYAPAPIGHARPVYGVPHGLAYGYRGHPKHHKHYKDHQRGKYGYGHVAFEHDDD
jgi:hypothetical protein